MRCIILAAGQGTRIHELTGDLNKCLLPVNGISVIRRTVQSLVTAGKQQWPLTAVVRPKDVAIFDANVGHFFNDIVDVYPSQGTAADAKRGCKRVFDGQFIIWYGDVLTEMDPAWLVSHHQSHVDVCGLIPCATLAAYYVGDPWNRSDIRTTRVGRVVSFQEKPERSPELEAEGAFAFAGIMIVDGQLLRAMPDHDLDFGRDVLPYWVKTNVPLFAHATNEPTIDIGTPENYLRARAMWH